MDVTRSKSQDTFLYQLEFGVRTVSLATGLCIVFWFYKSKALKQFKFLTDGLFELIEHTFFVIENLLFVTIIGCCARYINYCSLKMFLTDASTYARFLLSLTLSLFLHCIINNLDTGAIGVSYQSTIITSKYLIMFLLYCISMFLAFIRLDLTHFCLQFNDNVIWNIELVLWVPVIIMYLIIIGILIMVRKRVITLMSKISQSVLVSVPGGSNHEMTQLQIRIRLVLIMTVPFLLITNIHVTPALINYVVGNDNSWVLMLLDALFYNIYGSIIAIAFVFVIHYGINLMNIYCASTSNGGRVNTNQKKPLSRVNISPSDRDNQTQLPLQHHYYTAVLMILIILVQ